MTFEWDPNKAASNLTKHRVSFDLATLVWKDPLHVLLEYRNDPATGEQRWHAVGRVGDQIILVVVHTYPDPDDDEHVRIIGARKATSHERKRYEAEL